MHNKKLEQAIKRQLNPLFLVQEYPQLTLWKANIFTIGKYAPSIEELFAMTDEERKAQRRRMLKRVIISYNDGFSTCEAVIKDLSEKGALLELKGAIQVPEKFNLINDLDGYRVECIVKRYQGLKLGVEFVGEVESFEPRRTQTVNMLYTAEDEKAAEENEQKWREDRENEISSRPKPKIVKPVFGKRA